MRACVTLKEPIPGSPTILHLLIGARIIVETLEGGLVCVRAYQNAEGSMIETVVREIYVMKEKLLLVEIDLKED